MKPTLENYKNIVWTEENLPDEDYYNFFKSLDEYQKIDFLQFLLKSYPEYDTDWIQGFFDTMDIFNSKSMNDIQPYINFIDFLREECRAAYEKEFNYFDDLPALISIYNNDIEQLKVRFAQTIKEPAKAIDDNLRRVFFPLTTNRKHWDYAKSVAEQVWIPLRDADNLIGAAEFNYSLFLYCDYLEKAFDKINNEESVDWELFKENVEAIEFKYVDELKTLPKRHYEGTIDWEQFHRSKKYRSEHFKELLIHVLFTVYKDSGIPVYWVFRTWFDIAQYMLDDEQANSRRKNWFAFTPTMLDRFGGSLSGFLGSNKDAMIIENFTLPYIYDYLFKMDFIDEELYNKLMQICDHIRRIVFKIPSNSLWKYNPIYDWKKPNFVSEERFEAEKKLAHKTYDWTFLEAKQNLQAFVDELPALPKSAKIPPPPKSMRSPIFDLFSEPEEKPKKRRAKRASKNRKKKPKNNRKAGRKGSKRKK